MENRFAYNTRIESLHTPIISKIAEITGCELYLELGIMSGDNMRKVCRYSKSSIGVDINDCPLVDDNFLFYQMTTDEFFKIFHESPNIIFIDADHHFEQVKKDFAHSLSCLSRNGIIFLHDTDPYQQELLDQGRCGDSYKMHDWIKYNYPELDAITLPISIAGLTMVNRDKDRRILKFLNE